MNPDQPSMKTFLLYILLPVAVPLSVVFCAKYNHSLKEKEVDKMRFEVIKLVNAKILAQPPDSFLINIDGYSGDDYETRMHLGEKLNADIRQAFKRGIFYEIWGDAKTGIRYIYKYDPHFLSQTVYFYLYCTGDYKQSKAYENTYYDHPKIEDLGGGWYRFVYEASTAVHC